MDVQSWITIIVLLSVHSLAHLGWVILGSPNDVFFYNAKWTWYVLVFWGPVPCVMAVLFIQVPLEVIKEGDMIRFEGIWRRKK